MNLKTVDYSSEQIRHIDLKNFSVLDSDGTKICKEVNLSFHKGNTYVICGENGSGKTTLIEAIMGFNKRFSGEIHINGQDVLSDDIVYISANAYLSSLYNRELERLSSGQIKFEQIKLFTSTDKGVYIFDEPTNFIDQNKRDEIFAIISKLKKANKLIIIVSHDRSFFTEDNHILKIERI